MSLFFVCFCGWIVQSECLPGKFESPEDVRCYEQHWHYLYEARKHGLGEKVGVHMCVICLVVCTYCVRVYYDRCVCEYIECMCLVTCELYNMCMCV